MVRAVGAVMLFSVNVLSGCAHSLPPHTEEDRKQSEVNIAFQRKLQCKAFEKGLVTEAQQDPIRTTIIDSVFYSSRENSCLVAKRVMYLKNNREQLEIDDVLSNRELWLQDYDHMQDALSAMMALHKQIEAMK